MDLKPSSVQSLRPLGAVPVKNAKGEITMEKVKVQRYVSGRKPKYAKDSDTASSASEESEDDLESNNRKILPSLRRHQSGSLAFTLGKTNSTISEDEDDDGDDEDDDDDDVRLRIRKNKAQESISFDEEKLNEDPRMRRLKQFREKSKDESIRPTFQPQIIKSGLKNDENKSDNDDDDDDDDLEEDEDGDLVRRRRRHREVIDAEADDDDENDDENIERRHELLKQKLSQIELEEASADKHSSEEEEEDGEGEEDEESEYESEYSEDEAMPRLKPIFVSKKDRITINEKEEEEKKRAEAVELEAKLGLEERRKATLKMIEEDRRREEEEMEKSKAAAEEEAIIKGIAAIVTDDEDEETAFELWKVRELRRIKRDKEEEEHREQERREIERLRNMSEEERQEELKKNPRQVTNQQKRGKFRFLQKYYHRGAFYLDVEDDVLKRDFAQPTLEDHFDKSVLPSVMQVKNFGRAGRTKYTHLSDVDTTAFDSAWSAKDNVHAVQFHQSHGGGMKQSFDRPGKRKK